MSTLAHDRSAGLSAVFMRARGAVSRLHVTIPASKRHKAAIRADFRRSRGLDLSDDARAARIRRAVS